MTWTKHNKVEDLGHEQPLLGIGFHAGNEKPVDLDEIRLGIVEKLKSP